MDTKKINIENSFLRIAPQICAMMVVVLHQYSMAGLPYQSVSAHMIGFISHGICTVAVPTFFCISGYLFWSHTATMKDVIAKLQRRTKTVLLPFIAWNLFYAIIFYLSHKGGADFTFTEILSSILFFKYYFPMWYMFQLMVYFVLSPFLFYLLKDKKISIVIIIISVAVSIMYKSSIAITVDGMERSLIMFNYLAYYLLGAQISKFGEQIISNNKHLPNFWLCILLFILSAVLSHLFYDGYIEIWYRRIIVPIVFVLFALILKQIIRVGQRDIKLGVSPMFIYGVHGAVGLVIVNVFELTGWNNSLLRYLVLCALTIIGSLIVGVFLKRYLPRIYAVFTGFR